MKTVPFSVSVFQRMRPKTKQKRNDGGQKYPIIIICNEIHLGMDKFH